MGQSIAYRHQMVVMRDKGKPEIRINADEQLEVE
jgi:hypothetical protein